MTDDLLATVIEGSDDKNNEWLYQIDGLRKGRIDIEINAQGEWLHQGAVIRRIGLQRLLEQSLLFVDGDFVLRAPEQLLKIQVEDQPFLIVKLSCQGESEATVWSFNTASGMSYTINKEHPMELRPLPGQDLKTPVVHIRDNLWGRLNRNCYYQLMEAIEGQIHAGQLKEGVFIHSDGQRFLVAE